MVVGYYKDTQKKSPQFMETAISPENDRRDRPTVEPREPSLAAQVGTRLLSCPCGPSPLSALGASYEYLV